jgi:endo-1,4-beta-xylanase
MMKAKSKKMFGRIVLMGLAAMSFNVLNVHAQAPATQPSASLKDTYKGKFLIGTAFDPRNYSQQILDNIKANYNVVTPENCMKPGELHPAEDRYTFDNPDALVKWCQENNIQIVGHNLVWHSQTGAWFFQGITADNKDVLKERLHKHIQTVVGRYKGKLMGWDVVNEAIEDRTANTGEENLRNSSNWYRLLGPEFLTLAFNYAHEADPDAQLNYNDYNIEFGNKHKQAMALLKRLKADSPITGVGIQAHWDMGTNFTEVENSIKDFESLGLKIMITEMDITIGGANSGAMGFGGGGRRGGASTQPVDHTEDFKKQAEKYKQAFEMFLRHPSITRVTLWGINDSSSWKSSGLPLLFDGQMNAKPAFQAVIDAAISAK